MIGKQKKLALTTRGREEDEEEQEGEPEVEGEEAYQPFSVSSPSSIKS